MKKVTVLGAGGWGTALANVLGKKGFTVYLWVRRRELCEELIKFRENIKYLPGVLITANVHCTTDLEEAVKDTNLVTVATPSSVMREMIKKISPYITPKTPVVSAAKGFEKTTLLRMSQIIKEELGEEHPVAVLSGPNHAEEVGRDIPTATVVASEKRAIAEYVQDIYMSPKFRVYTNPDVVGVEIGGALKNIIALGAGITDGLGYGDNSKAALLTRGLTEIARLGTAMGGDTMTFAGLAGVGDLVATCTSKHSRNWNCGYQLGKGKTLETILKETNKVVEGVKAAEVVQALADKYDIEMPISREIYKVLYENKDPKEAVVDLMLRSKTHEMEEVVIRSRDNW
ncbi:glycerol 3-phosphate dehydrogenase (NAD(P)+) [Anaerobranca californiensis DSM 14826]|jgi:glycerol-3-phosphate dehydrogenase (NAD(P)+)|uniref:Glycerol-3-phosphate dehydrogenase [NAD(P)+] n=1 Tax=Anaerobranca californiensis DSM 14826 TaxID=1120989 RepID=A0A1M6N7D1_9FIRM|nr:NAD(P)H-dependent glycerol-3-phosphate dehydrogenase [Anaerobranca californiensis]SHJ91628.1 glycerol 3-phosphate dehydrogenase (NAD(P)+) [Anaerobranca californiensis DSM 14826]